MTSTEIIMSWLITGMAEWEIYSNIFGSLYLKVVILFVKLVPSFKEREQFWNQFYNFGMKNVNYLTIRINFGKNKI